MTLDSERLPWSVAAFLEKEPRDWNRRDWEYAEHLQLEAIESPEGEQARSRHRFQQQARETPVVHYDDPPASRRPFGAIA